MKKIERLAEEYAWNRPIQAVIPSPYEARKEGYTDGIRRGIELCREMMRNGPHGVVIWEHDIDQMLDYLDGDYLPSKTDEVIK